MTQVRLAEGAGIDVSTLRKLEHGHPSVSLGTLAMVLLVLGETGRLGQLMDISKDDVGLVLGIHGLPKRVRTAREQPLAGAMDKTTNADDDGVF
jgi:transcriptional regulator with XRE-family HTH domain